MNAKATLVFRTTNHASSGQPVVVDCFWTQEMMSDEVYANVTKNCDFDNVDGTFTDAACSSAVDAFQTGNIDGYNIYAPVCIDAPNGTYYPSGYLPGYDLCSDYPTTAYLNDPAVQMAFHARLTKWTGCAGEFDSVCLLPATRYFIQDLGLSVTTPWRQWTAKEEVGGYVQQYPGGFTFLSVRGAGHLVPSFQPERALVMLSQKSFSSGKGT